MTCALGFQELVSRNAFVKDLFDLGYDIDFIEAYFVVRQIPHLDQDGALRYGDLVSPVAFAEDGVIDPPTGNHQAWFRGSKPHGQNGYPLTIAIRDAKVQVTPEFATNYSFSLKLNDENGAMRDYVSFEEKLRTYLDVITEPALAAHPEAVLYPAIRIRAEAQGTPLRFPDTSSANYNLNDISTLLKGKKVAIVGLGGTGAYVLDLIARTHLERIALFDDDKVHIHTIFRMPGFIDGAIGKQKVHALARHYGQWHAGIEPINDRITTSNVAALRDFDFVFVAVDDGPARLLIVDWLSTNAIPFVDCGMGLNRLVDGLNGTVRITGVDRAAFERTVGTPYLPTGNAKEDEYRKQAQIAELNALNAALAVIRFKQHFRLFDRDVDAPSFTFETCSFELAAGGQTV
jgi:hypothetical protein